MKPVPDFENDSTLTEKQKRRRREYYAQREENIRKTGEWQRSNKQKLNACRRKRRSVNGEANRKYGRDLYQRNITKRREYGKQYWESHKDERKAVERRHRMKLKTGAIAAYGGHCTCCGEENLEFLTLDHIHNNGAEQRRNGQAKGGEKLYRALKKSGYPQGELQVLCMNCNFAKGAYGYCPHQEKTRLMFGMESNRIPVVRTRILVIEDCPKEIPEQERKAGARRKIKTDQVNEMLTLYRSGKIGISGLAQKFHVSDSTIYNTLHRLVRENRVNKSAGGEG